MAAAFIGPMLAGVLLCAGMTKLAVPGPLGSVVGALLPAWRSRSVPLVRLIALTEVGVAVALSSPATRELGAAAAGALGALFAAAGLTAAVRRLGSPCGCFGRAVGRPLGLRNVGFGLVMVVASAALLADSGSRPGPDGLPALGTATVALVLAGWLYRDVIRDLCPPLARAAQTRSSA